MNTNNPPTPYKCHIVRWKNTTQQERQQLDTDWGLCLHPDDPPGGAILITDTTTNTQFAQLHHKDGVIIQDSDYLGYDNNTILQIIKTSLTHDKEFLNDLLTGQLMTHGY